MEHKTVLCSAKFLSNCGLVSGVVLKNCSVDFSSWKLITESLAMELARSSLCTADRGLDCMSGDLVYGLSSLTVGLQIRPLIFVLDLGFFRHKKRQLV